MMFFDQSKDPWNDSNLNPLIQKKHVVHDGYDIMGT